jgi:hypothetical protein
VAVDLSARTLAKTERKCDICTCSAEGVIAGDTAGETGGPEHGSPEIQNQVHQFQDMALSGSIGLRQRTARLQEVFNPLERKAHQHGNESGDDKHLRDQERVGWRADLAQRTHRVTTE